MSESRAYVNVPDAEQIQAVLASGLLGAVELRDDSQGSYLHSPDLDGVEAPDGVPTDTASEFESLIRQINGLSRLRHGFEHQDIVLRSVAQVEEGQARSITTRANARGPIRPASDTTLALPAGVDLRSHPALVEALGLYARATTPADLYDIYEIVRKDIAGSQSVVDEWAGGKPQRDRFSWTAQQDRHARPSEWKPPPKPMVGVEPDAFIRSLLLRAISEAANGSGGTSSNT